MVLHYQRRPNWRCRVYALAMIAFVSPLFAQTSPPRDPISDGVGASFGEFRVDESGNAVYTMPLFAVPGTAGVAPKLALTYNSQGGIGPLGKGWSISGQSAISRCRKSREAGDFIVGGVPVDGNTQPVSYSNQDVFCLDGQRLLVVSGTYGDDGAEYRLELDPFTRIVSHGGNNGASGYSGPSYFTIQRKDGSTSEYGNTLNSRIELFPCTSSESGCNNYIAAIWALNRVEDSTGNYLLYNYLETGFSYDPRGVEYVLSSVLYTGKHQLPGQTTGSSIPYAGIYFNYDPLVTPAGQESQIGYQGTVPGTYQVGYNGFTQTQTLSSVEVRDQIDSFPQTLRFYQLNYSQSGSGSRFSLLRSISECRDNPAPSGVPDPSVVCYRPTAFRWSDAEGVGFRFDTQDITAGSGTNARVGPSRLGDIDGDGRTDVLWFRRDDPACSGGNRLRVGFGDRTESGGVSSLTLNTPDIPTLCTTLDASNGQLNTAFGLFDFDGDGRDDLAIADAPGTGARWHIYRSLGRPSTPGGAVFDTSTDLINVTISTADSSQDQAQFGDFNGDGLIDMLYPTGSNTLAIRFLQRKTDLTGFEFGPEYTLNAVPTDCTGYSCNLEVFHQPTSGFGVAADFTGDGKADLVLRVIRSSSSAAEISGTAPSRPALTFYRTDTLATDHRDIIASFESQRFYAFAMGNKDDSTHTQTATQYGVSLFVRNDSGPQDPRDFQFADFNGDGLADLFYYYPLSGSDDYRFALNKGYGFEGPDGSVVTGAIQNVPNREQLRLADVNGDGRIDVVYPSGTSSPCPGTLSGDRAFRYRTYTRHYNGFDDPSLGSSPENGAICLPGNGAKGGDTTDAEYFLADFDGDGGIDFLKLRDHTDSPDRTMSRANTTSRFKARDAITQITNGNGAITNITYQPMTNKAIYRRGQGAKFTTMGRGSVVSDVLSSTYVVSQVSSSAPTLSSPNAQSTIGYRYAGAKAQAGGRGYLGFSQIVTFDMNAVDGGFTATEQDYRQDFPFVGASVQTGKFVISGTPTRGSAELDACATNPEASGQSCFYNLNTASDAQHPQLGPFPPAGVLSLNGVYVKASASLWACKNASGSDTCDLPVDASPTACPDFPYSTAASMATARPASPISLFGTAHPSSITAQQPLFPYVPRTVDLDFDPNDAAITRHVCGLFQYDAYGNATQNTVAQFSNQHVASEVARKVTNNVFVNDTANWRLGRLMTSEIDDTRAGVTQSRFADFDYEVDRSGYTSPTKTGLLKSERLQRDIVDDQDLRTLYTLDDYGNRIGAFQCSRRKLDGSLFTDVQCKDKTLVQQRPTGTTGPATAVHRYSLTEFDSRGRYPIRTLVPFYSPSAARNVNEEATSTINERDEFGNVISQTSANGLTAIALYGDLGRAYYAADNAGKSVTTTFRWCSGAGSVSCPAGSSFRQQTVTAGAPTTFVYFDVLGRERLKVSQSFNDGIAGKNFTAQCNGYDAHGRPQTASIPFFLTASYGAGSEPSFPSDPCTGISATTTTFDTLGRARLITAPDGSTTSSTFTHLTTNSIDSRGQHIQQTKNVLGEVIQTIQADPATGSSSGATMTVTHDYDAQGNLRFVRRNAGSGEIVSEIRYDGLGRKTQALDPDRGTTAFQYNAAGEVIASTDARNNRVEQDYDAMGRRWRKRSGALGAFGGPADRVFANGFDNVAPSSAITIDAWQFDTATNGLGSLDYEQRQISTAGGTALFRSYTYDFLGRPSTKQTSFDGALYTESTTYDSYGRVLTQQDASGDTTTNTYTARGYLGSQRYSRTEVGSSGTFYEVQEQDAWGHTTRERRAGTLNTVTTFDAQRGWIDTVQTGSGASIQNWNFDFDSNGNLTRRDQNAGALVESLTYDRLNRLTQVNLSGFATSALTTTITYDALGNVCAKGPSGATQTYSYTGLAGCAFHGVSGSPHAVSQVTGPSGTFSYAYDANGNQTNADATVNSNDRTVTYDPLDQATTMTHGNPVTAQTDFAYGPNGDRYRRIDRTGGSITATTRYIGNVEVIIGTSGTETKRYLAGGAIVSTVNGGSATDRYALPDHLGSVDVVVNHSGSIVEASSFDAWGQRRNTANWQGAGAPLATTTHGFTGHEHVDGIGLIHMNGRIYDPAIGRFIQADSMIDAGTQGLNRYSYVLNNPLSLTDPSGHQSDWGYWMRAAITTAVAIGTGGIGGIEGFVMAGANGALAGAVESNSLKGAAWGAFSAVAFHGIGSYFNSAEWAQSGQQVFGTGLNAAGYSAKVLAHGVAGGITQHLQGGKFGSGFASAGVTEAFSGPINAIDPANPTIGSATRVMVAALVGGTVSDLTGNKFATGAVTAAFAQVFNEEADRIKRPIEQLYDFIQTSVENTYSTAMYALQTGDPAAIVITAATLVPGAQELAAFKAITNSIPAELARVVAGNRTLATLGRAGASDVFVVAAEDIAGMNAAQIAERLTIPLSDTYTVIKFPTPRAGIASPVFRENPGFLQGGLTAGGAREFVIPNGPIPAGATTTIIGNH